MNEPVLSLPLSEVRRLLGAGSGDGALLYLYLRSGADPAAAAEALRWPAHRVDGAMASLRQLGLLEDPRQRPIVRDQPPVYTEADVLRATERGNSFSLLVGEAQRRLGRVLSTEELKILLSLHDYLGLPTEVIGILITYCIQRSRARGLVRAPSLRTIEKEAYYWADQGIDTLEDAAFYMQTQLQKQTIIARVQQHLQLGDRRLTRAEEQYIRQWLDWGFGDDVIAMAYEKTCLNTGAMKWPYCNSILKSWHEKGLHTVQEVEGGDQRSQQAVYQNSNRRPPAGSAGQGPLGSLEQDALRRLLNQ